MVTFYWPTLKRQVSVEGEVNKIPATKSDAYFATRPHSSQISAWSSRQDLVIESRATLTSAFQSYEEKFKNHAVPRPDFWGGFCLLPSRYEFWQGGLNRLHHRFHYILDEKGQWKIERLSP